MAHFHYTILINCAPEKVWDFISEPKNRLKYDPDLQGISQSPEGMLKIGSMITETRYFFGRKNDMQTEVYILEPGKKIGYRTLEGDATNASGAYSIQEEEDGTRLTLDFTTQPKGIFKLATPFIARGLKRSIPAGLKNIRSVLEKETE